MDSNSLEAHVRYLIKRGQVAQAKEMLSQRIIEDPDDSQSLTLLVAQLTNENNWAEAELLLKGLIESHPAKPKPYRVLADIHRAQGNIEEAEDYYIKAWNIDPIESNAVTGLAGIKKHRDGQVFLQQIEDLIARFGENREELTWFHLAAGKVCDDMGYYENAFYHFQQGNRRLIKRDSMPIYERMAQRNEEIFTRKFLRKFQNAGCNSRLPIFVVGMPRTGTTLLEQMIGRHGKAEGLGELQDINIMSNSLGKTYNSTLPYPDSMELLQPGHAKQLGERYVEKMQAKLSQPHTERAVDKMPINFLHIGLIKTILPKAKIIHTVRHPLDTCLSCFFQPFGDGLDFSYSLESCAQFYRLYRNVMKHWQKLYKNQIHEVNYSDLVTDPEATMSKVTAHIGLNWDSACLGESKGESVVRTASYWQARQPVYKGSLERWRNYEPYIGDLRANLAEYL